MNVLVVAGHPDDDAIGCGGTMIAHAQAGDEVHALYLTSGEKGGGDDEVARGLLREGEAAMATQYLGTKRLTFWRQPDYGAAATVESVTAMRRYIAGFAPCIVYVPHQDESHPDHRAAAKTVLLALENRNIEATVWAYEVWTPMAQFDRVEDITSHIGTKIAAIRAHLSQVDICRFDEGAYHLARWRGELHNRPHGPFAEVFRKIYP